MVLDPDILSDYPPSSPLSLTLPPGTRLVYAQVFVIDVVFFFFTHKSCYRCCCVLCVVGCSTYRARPCLCC